jgi:hypothetical protein
MKLTHVPVYGPEHIHEFADGRKFQVRRDHAYSPDIKIEWRNVLPNNRPIPGHEEWVPFPCTEGSWDWLEMVAPDLLVEVRDEVLEAAS